MRVNGERGSQAPDNLYILFVFCLLPQLEGTTEVSQARFVDVSVDDPGPDHPTSELISYTPGPGVGSKLGQDCSDCTAGPQKALAYHQTRHDSTIEFNPLPGSNEVPNRPLFAQFRFNVHVAMQTLTVLTQGTAIYVYTILANTRTSPAGDSDVTFYLDGDVVGTFVKNAPGAPGFVYSVNVYSNDFWRTCSANSKQSQG
ncbi:hypothetical protein P691DRAFT_780672 [Macrolepiota fuliginosa MF-IS2]|uniref:Laminin G domain-containing protein n=1 Tax=Macrolepiota fuliginosa MF-IS2 TaxID=1400762 RepID=A0A9P5XF58_9AGAR|nr:hypothetical protein P691DRAFT_780672 [Macrolepiota fuliginosa MF-IS2]